MCRNAAGQGPLPLSFARRAAGFGSPNPPDRRRGARSSAGACRRAPAIRKVCPGLRVFARAEPAICSRRCPSSKPLAKATASTIQIRNKRWVFHDKASDYRHGRGYGFGGLAHPGANRRIEFIAEHRAERAQLRRGHSGSAGQQERPRGETFARHDRISRRTGQFLDQFAGPEQHSRDAGQQERPDAKAGRQISRELRPKQAAETFWSGIALRS